MVLCLTIILMKICQLFLQQHLLVCTETEMTCALLLCLVQPGSRVPSLLELTPPVTPYRQLTLFLTLGVCMYTCVCILTSQKRQADNKSILNKSYLETLSCGFKMKVRVTLTFMCIFQSKKLVSYSAFLHVPCNTVGAVDQKLSVRGGGGRDR